MVIFYRSKFFLFRESDRCLILVIFLSRIKQVILDMKEKKIHRYGVVLFSGCFQIYIFISEATEWVAVFPALW